VKIRIAQALEATATLMIAAALLIGVGTAIISVGVALRTPAAAAAPAPEVTPAPLEWMYIPYCEDTDGAGPCAMWDDRTDGAPAQWWIQPMLPLGKVYPDGAVMVKECPTGFGDGQTPCLWPGFYGQPADAGSDLHAVLFGGVA
jgi:hypothetical protein